MARMRDVIDHAAVFHRKGCALCLCVVSAHGTLCHGRQIPYRQQRSGECRAAAGIGAQELPFLPQPRGGIPCGHRLFAVGNMPLVGHKSGKMAYRCILPHSGLLRKTSGGTPAPHVDTAGAESPFLRFNIPKESEKIGGGHGRKRYIPIRTGHSPQNRPLASAPSPPAMSRVTLPL